MHPKGSLPWVDVECKQSDFLIHINSKEILFYFSSEGVVAN